eukprot:1140863-Amphidinium_carterae.1
MADPVEEIYRTSVNQSKLPLVAEKDVILNFSTLLYQHVGSRQREATICHQDFMSQARTMDP